MDLYGENKEVKVAAVSAAPPPQNVARQDSGVPEDLVSPSADPQHSIGEDDHDGTMNSECNITVIHVTESELNKDREKKDFAGEGKDSKDGSDSGVEGCAVEVPRDFGGSSGGLDEVSCDSSLVSCCSVYEEPCAILPDDLRLTAGGEGTSEGGSESSSIAGSVTTRGNRGNAKKPSGSGVASSLAKKKSSNAAETQKSTRTKPTSTVSNANVTPSTSRSKPVRNILGTRDRGRSREKPQQSVSDNVSLQSTMTTTTTTMPTITTTATTSRNSATSRLSTISVNSKIRTRPTPDSLPSILTTEISKDLSQRARVANVSKTRGSSSGPRGGLTPSDERKKPIVPTATKPSLVGLRAEIKNIIRADRMSTSLDSKALNAYVTLPRRNRNKIAPKTGDKGEKVSISSRSRSGSRDTSLNRIVGKKMGLNSKESSLGYRTLPPCPKSKTIERTRIYHETSVQTGLTGPDLDSMLAGVLTILPNPESAEKAHNTSQTEGTWEDMQTLQSDVKRVSSEIQMLKAENEKLKTELKDTTRRLEEEQAEHSFARQELERNAQRVLAMLGTPVSEQAEGSDSFLELETHFQSSGQVVADQQLKIADLQSLCRILNRDLEKSLAAQKSLLQQQQDLEAEASEMQDFLQEEKSTLAEALREAELDIQKIDEEIKLREIELERKTEECKHLVRISEQRRQENLSLSMKVNAIERRSRELLLAQGATVSGAAVALSGLGNRLEGLVDQLITSYNISEKDLEDVVYHNEAYSRSNSSIESSPVSSKHSFKDCTPSPKRGSFVLAVIGAIRNAATHPFATKNVDKRPIKESAQHMQKELSTESSSELLDFETEPCLMMESVLEDVPLPDTYSHNMVSSSDSLRRALSVPESVDEVNLRNVKSVEDCNSLSNLTQAILHRRKVEDEEDENCESLSESETGPTDSLAPLSEYCSTVSLVDQVIDVDNLVTKLLKVLRIIQLDNDTCIQELREQKCELESKLKIFLLETKEIRKTITNSHEAEELQSIPKESRKSINRRHLMKEMKALSEEMVNHDDSAIDGKFNSSDSTNDDHDEDAADILSSRSCS